MQRCPVEADTDVLAALMDTLIRDRSSIPSPTAQEIEELETLASEHDSSMHQFSMLSEQLHETASKYMATATTASLLAENVELKRQIRLLMGDSTKGSKASDLAVSSRRATTLPGIALPTPHEVTELMRLMSDFQAQMSEFTLISGAILRLTLQRYSNRADTMSEETASTCSGMSSDASTMECDDWEVQSQPDSFTSDELWELAD